ncbi:helix-turn-helix transcriptional regulator [Paenibacillus larvae]|uniref:Helix-turn-helix family protein n=1 Tax=Paenibacillus larvae subsp. larvae TaxID=147375 RepID=A0A6C0QMF8_9BACL|nr:helix-turn-helix transcriptional regulator [Paenibacillus larvae]QHZ49904.1 helix-turn-helix family protein [Paenibacillus larvae subsp. larvae]
MSQEAKVTIAELRARNGKMTQTELAMKIGTSQTTISTWEKDISVISAPHLKRLCLFFNVSADELLGIDGVKSI